MTASDVIPEGSHIILEAVTGSKAYGLDTPSSDTDMKAVYVAPTERILALHPPQDTIERHDPDTVLHELGKFVRLALKCNPTILELLFLDEYTVRTWEANDLITIRRCFLSSLVEKSYGGYAVAQARRLQIRGGDFGSDLKNRYAKHARHCFRLMDQGQQLKTTGDLTVRVSNRDELFAIGELPPDELAARFEERFAEFNAAPNILPDHPDEAVVESVLLGIRRVHYGKALHE